MLTQSGIDNVAGGQNVTLPWLRQQAMQALSCASCLGTLAAACAHYKHLAMSHLRCFATSKSCPHTSVWAADTMPTDTVCMCSQLLSPQQLPHFHSGKALLTWAMRKCSCACREGRWVLPTAALCWVSRSWAVSRKPWRARQAAPPSSTSPCKPCNTCTHQASHQQTIRHCPCNLCNTCMHHALQSRQSGFVFQNPCNTCT